MDKFTDNKSNKNLNTGTSANKGFDKAGTKGSGSSVKDIEKDKYNQGKGKVE